MAEHASTDQVMAVFMIDVDRFKTMNDTYGHLAGDKLLQHVGNIISRAVGDHGQVFRYAGDEFTVLAPETTKEDALELSQGVVQSIAGKAFKLSKDGDPERITLSLGVALFPSHGDDASDLIDAADQALYQAKQQGRNCLVVHGPTHTPQHAISSGPVGGN